MTNEARLQLQEELQWAYEVLVRRNRKGPPPSWQKKHETEEAMK